MYLKRLSLKNFRGFREASFEIIPAPGVYVIVGPNGQGKTSTLDALAIALTWFTSRLEKQNLKVKGKNISDSDKTFNSKGASQIAVDFEYTYLVDRFSATENKEHTWNILTLVSFGSKPVAGFDYSGFDGVLQELLRTPRAYYDYPVVSYFRDDRLAKFNVNRKRFRREEAKNIERLYRGCLEEKNRFEDFFTWVREMEDEMHEYEYRVNNGIYKQVDGDTSEDETWILRNGNLYTPKMFDNFRRSIEMITEMLEGFSQLRVERKPRLRMRVNKNGVSLDVNQLSAGERAVLAMTAEICKRAFLSAGALKDFRYAKGIVMIDELDLHLHPGLQRRVVKMLPELFPNIQFIVTSHSPQIISQVPPEHVIRIMDSGNGLIFDQGVTRTIGVSTNDILDEVMSDGGGRISLEAKIAALYAEARTLIDANRFDEARVKLDDLLKNDLSGAKTPDWIELDSYLEFSKNFSE